MTDPVLERLRCYLVGYLRCHVPWQPGFFKLTYVLTGITAKALANLRRCEQEDEPFLLADDDDNTYTGYIEADTLSAEQLPNGEYRARFVVRQSDSSG